MSEPVSKMATPKKPHEIASPLDAKFLILYIANLKTKPDVDWEKLTQEMGYKTVEVTRTRFNQIRRKLTAETADLSIRTATSAGASGDAGEAKAPKTPKAPRKRKAQEDESEGGKLATNPKPAKRAKVKNDYLDIAAAQKEIRGASELADQEQAQPETIKSEEVNEEYSF